MPATSCFQAPGSFEQQLGAVRRVAGADLAQLAVQLEACRAVEGHGLGAVELDRLVRVIRFIEGHVRQHLCLFRLPHAHVAADRHLFQRRVSHIREVDVRAVEPTVEGFAPVGHVGLDGCVLVALERLVVLNPDHLGLAVALDVEHVVALGQVAERSDALQGAGFAGQDLTQLAHVPGPEPGAAVRGGAAARDPQVLVWLLAVPLIDGAPPGGREEGGLPQAATHSGVVERVVDDPAGVLVRQHRDESVAWVGGQIVHHSRDPPALRTADQRPDACDPEVREALSPVAGRGVDGSRRVDGRELDGDDRPVLDAVAARGGPLEEAHGLLAKRRGVRLLRVGELDRPGQQRRELRIQLVQVHAAREDGVGRVESPGGGVQVLGAQGGEPRVPAREQGVQGDADAEDALRIERAHNLEALLAVGRPVHALATPDRLGHTNPVEALHEALVLLVRAELDHPRVDQLLVGRAPQQQIVEIRRQLGVAHYDRHAHLVAARQADVHALRILRPRRKARVEGGLVPMEIDSLRWLAPVPGGVAGVQRPEAPRAERDGQREQDRRPAQASARGTPRPTDPHLRISARETCSSSLPAAPSSEARAGMFLTESLPRKGRHWKSHSFPALNPNSMSQGRAFPAGSRAGSKVAEILWPAAMICLSSSASSTVSLPLDGTMAAPPPGRSWFFHGDLNSVTSSTFSGDQSSVSAEVPSTAPPTPSEVATVILPVSPELTSAVTSTPDLSLATDSRITTEDSTQIGSSMRVWRHEKERNSNGDAHTSFTPS